MISPIGATKRRSGFTLLELLAVLAVFGIIVFISAGFMYRGTNRMRDAANKLSSDIQSLHLVALKTGKFHRIQFQEQGVKYSIEEFSPPKPKPKEEDREALQKWEDEQRERNSGLSGNDRASQTRIDRGAFSVVKQYAFPEPIRIKNFLSPRFQEEVKDSKGEKQDPYILFLPSGELDQALIVLEDGSGRLFSLEVNGLSGRVTATQGEITREEWLKTSRLLKK